MPNPRKTIALSSLLALVLASTASITAASANQSSANKSAPFATGLVRIDSPWASVKTLSDGREVITFSKDANGQWFGELGQNNIPVVKDIKDSQLVRHWNLLGHDQQGAVPATFTWNNTTNYELLELSNPELTPRGHLRFELASTTSLPQRMENTSINFSRASTPTPRFNQGTINTAITSDVLASTYLSFAFSAKVTLSNSGYACYIVTLAQPAPIVTGPANLKCGPVTFTSSTYTMTLPPPTGSGNVFLAANVSSGGAPFAYNAIIATWTQAGV